MKRAAVLAALPFLFLASLSAAMGSSQGGDSASTNPATEKAREDYRAYVAQLKELGRQYGQITSEVSKVIKEEGVPAWDESTGTIKMTKDIDLSSKASAPGAVHEADKEIKIVIEVPGLKKDSIRVEIENERLVRVRAVKKAVEPGSTEQEFESAYELPSAVQDKNASARYEDGVLTVTLQKIQAAKKIVPVTVR